MGRWRLAIWNIHGIDCLRDGPAHQKNQPYINEDE